MLHTQRLNILGKYLRNNVNQETLSIVRRSPNYLKKRKQPIQAMQRKWQPDMQKVGELKDSSGRALEQFRLLSYNILAQDLLVNNMFLYYDIDNIFLRWDYRLKQIVKEVSELQPDILCLQEVQHTHLKELVQQLCCRGLEKRRMEYVFKKRTGNRCDGCAIVYDRAKFKLVNDQSVEYFTEDDAILNRENIALMAKFQLRDNPRSTFIAANTHLLYNPRRRDVRIGQINKLMSALNNFSKVHGCDKRWPFILAGDMNCIPRSAEYNVLTAITKPVGQNSNAPDCNINMENINFGDDTASTFQGQWVTVDYVLRSGSGCQRNEKNIQVNSVYKLPTVDACRTYGKLPNKCNGSDHLSLAFQFSIV